MIRPRPSRLVILRRWLAELVLSLRLAFLAVMAGAGAALAALGEYTATAALAAAGLLALGSLYRKNAPPSTGETLRLRIGHFNVNYRNQRLDALAGYLTAHPQDVMSLLEVSDAMAAVFDSLADHYPHRLARPREIGGRALLSRWPLTEETHDFGSLAVIVKIESPGGTFRLLQIHPRSPRSGARTVRRDRMIDAIAAARDDELPLIVVGDFNTVGWSPVMRRLMERRALVDLASIPWPRPTWPAPLPIVPIDHLLAPKNARLCRARTRRVSGSDHLALEIDMELPVTGAGAAS